ncbi:MerR family transcriptional regulator [Leifsonia shinshuensis]|uniref:MerR family transcriptional regulator n=1 Tax=Leifsonia shinshuensis TaxID=150026 RepID=UPI001F5111F0|nr:MerR family transcriptional regulator [Leifsonia shinshuensis]MCI0155820.1 MerR family transcriptional regulator [Leifsonia shinshuensis]
MSDPDLDAGTFFSTGRLAAASGYSGQQLRDLERLAVIPPALRKPNGYRRFDRQHLIALRAYRGLAVAIGPVAARAAMRELRTSPYDEAIARIVALHVSLAVARDEALAALRALDAIDAERAHDAPALPGDAMTITELSVAIGVRSSTLRFWEQQGLITPERDATSGARRYPPDAVRNARIVRSLRAGGYRIPDVRVVLGSLIGSGNPAEAREALRGRLQAIAVQSEALVRAGADLADLLTPPEDGRSNGGGR